MTFGEPVDWVRNVRAAGGWTIEWNGTSYPVSEPEIIDRAAARSAFSPVERLFWALMGIKRFMHLRHVPGREIRPLLDEETAGGR